MCSHLFQRVASFLLTKLEIRWLPLPPGVLISFREWLHSYLEMVRSLSGEMLVSSHLFQRVASFLRIDALMSVIGKEEVLISFREWLHSYTNIFELSTGNTRISSHLFQRVASFLLN